MNRKMRRAIAAIAFECKRTGITGTDIGTMLSHGNPLPSKHNTARRLRFHARHSA